MPRKTKDLKFSRVPFAFKDSTSSGSFRVRVSTLNQGAVFSTGSMAADQTLLSSSARHSTEPLQLQRGASERGNLSAIADVVAGVMRRQLKAAW